MKNNYFCCSSMEDKINRYIDDCISKVEKTEVEEHIKKCNICKKSYNDYMLMNEKINNEKNIYNNNNKLNEEIPKNIMFKIRNLKNNSMQIDDDDLDYINAAGNNFDSYDYNK